MSEVQRLVDQLTAARREADERLSRLSEAEMEIRTEFYGAQRMVRFILYQMGRHEREHIVHIRKIRQALNAPQSEAHMILAQNQATRGELLAELMGLSDEELNRQPAPEEWSVRQVLAHAIEVERRYLAAAEKALAEAKAGQG